MPVYHEGDGHLVTIAPTGSGKGVSAAIPALLTWQGPAVIIDPKGEAYHVTSAYRERTGYPVYVLDPFQVTDAEGDSLNPLQLLLHSGDMLADDAAMLAHLLSAGTRFARDPFWDDRASTLITGLILALHEGLLDEDDKALPRSLSVIRTILSELLSPCLRTPPGWNVSGYAVLDGATMYAHLLKDSTNPEIRAAAAVLQLTRRTLSGIVATAEMHLSFLRAGPVSVCIDQSTIFLDAVQRGAPMTIYIVLPPDKLESHSRLLRLWLSVLITVMSRRKTIPTTPTLMLVDEAGQLGGLPSLLTAVTLLRGYGVKLWSFWQDMTQLQACYPDIWPTLLNNCTTQQFFAPASPYAAHQLDDYLAGSCPTPLRNLKPDDVLVTRTGQPAQILKRATYLSDAMFVGRYAPNPFYANRPPHREALRLTSNVLPFSTSVERR